MAIRFTLLCGALLLASPPAGADPPAPPAPERAARESELHGLETNLKASEDERRKIEADVEAIKLDHARLNEALVETTARLQQTEADRTQANARLARAAADAAKLEAGVGERRERLADWLAALQRLTRDPPPALFVSPDDMTRAVRAAGLVVGVVGDIKAEADGLAADLAKAADLKRQIDQERAALTASAEQLALDRTRLAALVEARQKALADRSGALDAERKRADQLAAQAGTLKDLIGRMDGDLNLATAADKAAALAKGAPKAGPDPARLQPAVAFSEMKGRLPWPASGTTTKAFGDPDGYGGQSKGVSIAVAPGAVVSAPADAWVAYAGPYRSYGQLLILNAGEGYYLVLAGMERIQVAVGQFVLAGEPVAAMGAGAKVATTGSIGADPPVLYIELRKNDAVIDPQPWWAKSNLEKARG